MANCSICGKTLNNPLDALSYDCGGDCVLCMADIGDDPDCIESVKQAVAEGKPILDTETDRIKKIVNPHDDRIEYSGDSLHRRMSHYD